MKIKLWAALMEDALEASVQGDVITINGESIDLSGIPDGYRLPGSAVGNKFFVETDYVERIGKTLHFTLRLPVAWDSPEEYRNPLEPIVLDARCGLVKFPDTSPPKLMEPEVIESSEQLEVPEDGRSIEA
ncbi:hypothetical protein AO066_18185 [Pseudomonas fluorescens]|nr:hypothetical protein AO066_18185 [Pseudomonas fluorescens]